MVAKQIKKEIVSLNLGRIPPQSLDLEEAVLGACLLERETFELVKDIIHSHDCFYSDAHQKIYKAIIDLHHSGSMIDLLTVGEQLRKSAELDIIGGQYFLSKLSESVLSSAHCQQHAYIIMEKYMQRELIRISGAIISDAYEDATDVFDLIERAETEIKQITSHIITGDNISVGQSLQKVIANYEHQKQTKSALIGISSGLYDLDNITGGWKKPGLILLAAFPSIGKTALMLNFCLAVSKNKLPSKIYSLETGDISLTTRIAAAYNRIPLEGISKATLNPAQEDLLYKSINVFHTLKIFISQKIFYIEDIEKSARKEKKKNPDLALICVDFIQLVKVRNGGKMQRDEIIAYVARQLKLLSAELQVPIIALSQRKRSETGVKDRKPTLDDLAGTRELEWNADVVIFIHYQGGEPILIVAKNKDGKCDEVKVKFDADIQLWGDHNDFHQNVLPGVFKTNSNYQVSSQDRKESWNDEDAPF